jgi:hypothetical protein
VGTYLSVAAIIFLNNIDTSLGVKVAVTSFPVLMLMLVVVSDTTGLSNQLLPKHNRFGLTIISIMQLYF